MAIIGLSVSRNETLDLLNQATPQNTKLIGLNFKPNKIVAGSPVSLSVSRVVFNDSVNVDPVDFILSGTLEGSVYREVSGPIDVYLQNSNSPNALPGDVFQFWTDENFAYFPTDGIYTLASISNNVIISGASLMTGLVAYPNSNLNSQYATLKMEVDRASMTIKSGQHNARIPAAVFGNPCPPVWDPF